jgi:hypothetical protein
MLTAKQLLDRAHLCYLISGRYQALGAKLEAEWQKQLRAEVGEAVPAIEAC